MRAARAWFIAEFKPKSAAAVQELCPPGSERSAQMRMVVSYWDMAASFVNSGVLNEEMFFTNCREMLIVWLRMKPVLDEIRAAYRDPAFLKNLEVSGGRYKDYLDRTAPGTFDAFAARMGG